LSSRSEDRRFGFFIYRSKALTFPKDFSNFLPRLFQLFGMSISASEDAFAGKQPAQPKRKGNQ